MHSTLCMQGTVFKQCMLCSVCMPCTVYRQ